MKISTANFSITAWKVSKYRVFSGPQGYDQKRKLFRTNSFVFAHSSAKRIYNEKLTLKSTIQWYHMTECDMWRHSVRIQENTDQKKLRFGLFSRSV